MKKHQGRRAMKLGKSMALAAALASIPAGRAAAGTAYAVFGNTGVTVGDSTVTGGLLGSNTGTVSIGTFSTFGAGLAGGGSLVSTAGSVTVGGPTTFAGGVTFGSFDTFNGAVNVGGDASFGSSATFNAPVNVGGSYSSSFAKVNTDLNAGVDVNLSTSFDKVTGNVTAGRNATVQGTVAGDVTYGGTLTTGAFTHLGSSTHAPVSVTPTAFVPEVVPKADVFTAGGANVTNGGSVAAPIAPGSYDTLNVAWPGDVYLTAGNYYFNSINLSGAQDFHLENLTGGNKIRIFVTGDVALGSLMSTYVNEQPFAQVDPVAGASVLWETLGNFTIDPLSDDKLVGTVFAPNGNVSLGQYAEVDGSVIAGGTVTASNGLVVNFAALPTTGAYVVPEPAMVGVGALGAVGILRRRRAGRR